MIVREMAGLTYRYNNNGTLDRRYKANVLLGSSLVGKAKTRGADDLKIRRIIAGIVVVTVILLVILI